MSFKCVWDKLPVTAVLDIFSYLPTSDQANASAVCKSWYKTLKSPPFWKSLDVLFCSRQNDFDIGFPFADDGERILAKRGLAFPLCNEDAVARASRCGPFIQYLSVTITNPPVILDLMKENTEVGFRYMKDFFQALLERDNRPQIHHLYFTGCWPYQFDAAHYQRAKETIARFLNTQKQLVDVCFDCEMDLDTGGVFLEAIGSNSSESMSRLHLAKCFQVSLKRSPQLMCQYLSTYTKLVEVVLLYKDFGSNLLMTLVNNCQRTLKSITIIMIFDSDDDLHTVQSNVWKRATNLVPFLRVELDLGRTEMTFDVLKKLLSNEIPVSRIDAENTAAKPDCIQHFSQSFPRTLEEASLHLPTGFDEALDDAVVSLVTSCRRLLSLRLYGHLHAYTAEKLLKLRMRKKTGIRLLFMEFQNLSEDEENQLKVIKEENEYLNTFNILNFTFSTVKQQTF